MQELLRSFSGVKLVPERVHSRSDLKKFLDLARRDHRIRVVHIVSHGRYSVRRPVLILTGDEKINLAKEGRTLFKDLNGKVILFSCCEIGYDDQLMRSLLKASGAKAVFSYADSVKDSQALITEALFYYLAHPHLSGRSSTRALRHVHEQMRFMLPFLGIDRNRDALSHPLFVADFAEDLRP